MSNADESKRNEPREIYVQLANLAHDSFGKRRSYEWKLHFGLWTAVGAVVYSATRHKLSVFNSTGEAAVIGGLLFCSYFLHYTMVSRGHRMDKKWKHYYMDLAEGISTERPAKPRTHWLIEYMVWATPYMVFTGCLLYSAGRILGAISDGSHCHR